jgi:hypothetical protein
MEIRKKNNTNLENSGVGKYKIGKLILTDLLIAQTQWAKVCDDLIEAKTEYKLR